MRGPMRKGWAFYNCADGFKRFGWQENVFGLCWPCANKR